MITTYGKRSVKGNDGELTDEGKRMGRKHTIVQKKRKAQPPHITDWIRLRWKR